MNCINYVFEHLCKSHFITSLLIFMIGSMFAQTQIGGDIDGTSGEDELGWNVAISNDGNRVIVGAPVPNFTTTSPGYARVYDYDGSNWVQVGADIIGEAAQDRFGIAVAMSADGNRVAVGASLNSGSATFAGHTRIYDFNGTDWIQIGNDIEGQSDRDQSGSAIDLSKDGTRIIISSSEHNQQQGRVRVFEYNGTDWTQAGNDVDGSGNRVFGRSVSISADGTRFAAGGSSKAQIFEWDGADWMQLGNGIVDSTPYVSGMFIVDLSSSGNQIVVGYENGGYVPGETRVYEFDGNDWMQLGAVITGDEPDMSGFSVSISESGNRIAVGSPFSYVSSLSSGWVSIYDFDGTNWMRIGNDIVGEDAINNDANGWSTALTADGLRLITGSPRNNENGSESGNARVFQLDPVTITSIEEIFNSLNVNLEVTPNPNKGQFIISFDNLKQETGLIQLISSEGKLMSKHVFDRSSKKIHWENNVPSSSIYFLRLTIGDQFVTKKIVTVSK